jgi:hypothetical protein
MRRRAALVRAVLAADSLERREELEAEIARIASEHPSGDYYNPFGI